MSAAPALLPLIWLASPALPVGGFSYSEGLEAAVESGHVHDESSTREWLLDQLALSFGRSDLAATAAAVCAWQAHDHRGDGARIETINRWVLQTRETHELRQQSEQMGRSMLEWLRNLAADDARLPLLAALRPCPTWPVAMALALARAQAPTVHEALLAHAFGWAENMVQAALKAVPLGQSAGQRILRALSEALPAAVEHALALDDTTRQAFAPGLAILCARHETQYSRLFRS